MRRRSVLIGVLVVAVLVQGAPALAQENLQSGVQNPVRQIIAGMEQQQKRKLAILDFAKLDGSADNLTRYLTEQLATHMVIARRKFDVIERKHLDKILAEQGLNLSGIIEPQNARQVGRLSGVDAIATGSVTEHPTALEVTTRLIDTETGKVFAAAITRFTKDREVLALLGLEEQRSPVGSAERGHLSVPNIAPAGRPVELQDIAVRNLRKILQPIADVTRDYLITDCVAMSEPLFGEIGCRFIERRPIRYKVRFETMRRVSFERRKLASLVILRFPRETVELISSSSVERGKIGDAETLLYNPEVRPGPDEFCLTIRGLFGGKLAELREALETLSERQLPGLN